MLMRIAFMVMAHTDAKQVKNLAIRLVPNRYFDSRIFLHIDAKASIEPFNEVIAEEHVRLTGKRINVVRCGVSQVEAALELMRTVLESGERFDRYVLITGQDYPVISNEELCKRLKQGIEFMRGYKVTGSSMNNKVRNYYFYNKTFTETAIGKLSRRFIQSLVKPFPKKDRIDFHGQKWDVHYSSAYFAVSHELLCELYEKGMDKGYFQYFKTAICSDEMYFITIAANGNFRNRLEMIDNPSHTLQDNSSITYFDYQNRPTVLTQKDYGKIISSGRMFARKFSSEESIGLINTLNAQ